MKTIGERLHYYRNQKGKSINQLARDAGVSTTYISQLESNKFSNPTLDVVEKIAEALGIDFIFLARNNKSKVA